MSSADSSQAGKPTPRIGSYRFLHPLGTGGMSSVFHAVHVKTGHEVAVKVLPRSLAKNPTLLQRFLGEAKNAESLEHPNIASIFDRGFDQGRHYLVLEYVEGGDLHDRIRANGPLGLSEAVKAIRAVAEGLLYALGRGVIHRDIKPANLLLTPGGQIKIIDLGLALQTENEDERVTRDGTTVGTVDYMSPEQARDSRATSERSDIYSLGCTFYFLLTGKPPYPGGNVPDKLGRHCTAPIPDVRELRPEASEPLAALIKKMMAKKPEGRFPTYAALTAALDALPEALPETEAAQAIDVLIDEDEDVLIDDDDDESPNNPIPYARESAPPKLASRGDRPPRTPDVAPLDVSLADLAEIDADDRPPSRSRARPIAPPASDRIHDDAFEASDEPTGSYRPSAGEVPLSTWIATGAIVGLAIAFLGFGVLQVLGPKPTASVALDGEPPSDLKEAVDPSIPNEISTPTRTPIKTVAPPSPARNKAGTKGTPPPVVAWHEPAEVARVTPPERSYPSEVEAASLPAWARLPIPSTIEGPSVTLRRVVDPSDESAVSSLRQALDRNGGVVEIADDGPFFEDDCRLVGKSRLIRAKPGYRPMVMIRTNASTLALVRDRSAVFSVDGNRLILEGIDLIVDARELPPSLTALFALRGAELILNDCTVTILNASARPLALARIEEPADERANRSSRVRIERSLVRVSAPTAIETREPNTTRERMSRPRSSVPKK